MTTFLANLGKVHAVSDRMSVRGMSLLLPTQLPRPSRLSRQTTSPIFQVFGMIWPKMETLPVSVHTL